MCIHGCHHSLFVPHGFTSPTSVKWWSSLGAKIASSWAEIWKREISRTNYSPITAVLPVVAIGISCLPFPLSILNSSLPQLSAGLVLDAYLMKYLKISLPKSKPGTLCSSLIIREGCANRCQSGSQPCPTGPHWPHHLGLLPFLNSFCLVASVMFFQYPRHPSTFSEMLVLSAWTLSLDTHLIPSLGLQVFIQISLSNQTCTWQPHWK